MWQPVQNLSVMVVKEKEDSLILLQEIISFI